MNKLNLWIIGLTSDVEREHMFEYEFDEYSKEDFTKKAFTAFDEACEGAKNDLGFVVGLNYKDFPEKSFMSFIGLDSMTYARGGIIELAITRLDKSIKDEIKKMDEGEKNE